MQVLGTRPKMYPTACNLSVAAFPGQVCWKKFGRRAELLVSLRLGRSHTIELGLHVLFPLTMGALTWLLALAFFPRVFPSWTTAMNVFVAGMVVLIDSLAGLLHEL